MREIQAPSPFAGAPRPWVFLAGSIEMGQAGAWQARAVAALAEAPGTALNPRRDAWDASWRQAIDSPLFAQQVTWELDAQEQADRVLMYFDPGTRAPITLLELGLFARSGRLVVCCPEGFWRKGNVDVVCARYGVPQAGTLEEMLADTERWARG